MHSQPQIAVNHSCFLGEGPVWDAANNCIYWVDIIPADIHRYSLATQQHEIFNVGKMVGAIVLRKSGGLVAALQNGFAFIDFYDKTITPIADPEANLPGNRFNDGKCDPAGRFWAGTMPFNEKEPVGNVYMLDTDLSVTRKIEGVTISNGLAWTADNKIFYYIDTPTRLVVAYDYNVATGSITNKRVAVDVHNQLGYPDGMTIDKNGMLWIAFFGGWQVAQFNPHTGEKLQTIALPAANITCCTFGGADLTDLYVTSATKELTAADKLQQPNAGCLFVIKNIEVGSVAPYEFGG
jgi:sugar lactone lactonase YvrE